MQSTQTKHFSYPQDRFFSLRKHLFYSKIDVLSIRFSSSKSTRPPGVVGPIFRPAPGVGQRPGEHKSSPRPGARDGMKQEPYELRSGSARSQSKGEATNADADITPFLASEKMGFHHRLRALCCSATVSTRWDCRRHVRLNRCPRAREMTWATKKL
jgi:hypothetical protein